MSYASNRIPRDVIESLPTPSQVVRSLPFDLVEQVIAEWIEAHESGWRPGVYAVQRRVEVHEDLTFVLDQIDKKRAGL